jgi:hypothetical protein
VRGRPPRLDSERCRPPCGIPKTCLRPWAEPAVAVAWRAVRLHPIGRMAAWRPRIGPPIASTPAPSVAGRPAADRAGRYLQSQAILAQAAGNVRLEFRLASSLCLCRPPTDNVLGRLGVRWLPYTSTTFGRGLAPSVLVRYIIRSFWGAAAASPLVYVRGEPQQALRTGHPLAASTDGRAAKCDNRLHHCRDALPFDFFG